ncbi:hypothetical protein P168DRAFT_158187 [Aspergillus campestris IBT 28561]|uniref:Uncharacterized protein n=1 Tax=Aspergillus campestris (strain IBT 28561) TaxID=1392248 RepID=A0A2I1D3I1_ASPC2|nr:uncharacterized protein P168DRAFT_158187 [Aspergillus campestris IBT 28561]PKY04431.1 hypothetical protein P168DRAFT_158187 [Aspergillus campestris IBT 28561]
MHFYSIFITALTVSTALANLTPIDTVSNCLDFCKDEPVSCPPETDSTQMASGCWACCSPKIFRG